MTTLKQAYESIGETIQVGDVLYDNTIYKIEYVEGWYFAYSKLPETLAVAERFQIGPTFTIHRYGKQIYPVLHSKGIASNVLQCLRDGNKKDAVDWIEQLIDAKIKESK